MANDVQVSRELFLNNTPMLDTRAPVEFGKGHSRARSICR